MIKNYTKLYKMCNLVCKIECSTYNNLGPIMHDFQKLSNHPLVLALAEFRFSAVLDIEKHIPSFQDKIRTIFPLTNELSSQEVQVNPNGIEVRQNKEWAFISRKEHIIPLPLQALSLLNELKRITSDSLFLFPSRSTKKQPISNNTFNKALKSLGYQGRQTPHGFRHILSTTLREKGFRKEYVETALAHAWA